MDLLALRGREDRVGGLERVGRQWVMLSGRKNDACSAYVSITARTRPKPP